MNAILPPVLNGTTILSDRPLIRIVILGSVDHGKSTLIGRLLHETGSLPDGKLDHLKAVSARRGMPFEWAFLLDALQTERDQGITIDTSQIRFRTDTRDFVLIDAPGHAEFLRNMITGAAQADAAVLMVDATEGVREQTRRHCYLIHLLGIRQLIVVVNKMDRLAYDVARFREIETEITCYLNELGLTPAAVIPASAREGVGIIAHHATFAAGVPTVIEALERFAPAQQPVDLDLRLPIQAVYKFDDRRILAGRIESGRLTAGDEVILMPSGKTARVKSIEVMARGGRRGGTAGDIRGPVGRDHARSGALCRAGQRPFSCGFAGADRPVSACAGVLATRRASGGRLAPHDPYRHGGSSRRGSVRRSRRRSRPDCPDR